MQRVRGKTEKQISIKSGVESGKWYTGVEFICSECAIWQWLGGRMQESGKKNQLLDGNSNPKEASKNCTLMASITQGCPTSYVLAHKVFLIWSIKGIYLLSPPLTHTSLGPCP